MAKTFREWDVDKLEEQMPYCMQVEWIRYLDWEIAQWTEAILGAIPTAKAIESNSEKIVTDPEEKAKIFEALGNLGAK